MEVPVWVWVPIIPGKTNDEENITAIADFVVTEMPTVERLDLLAYNNLCADDYRHLDMPFPNC